jgi:hypothetical protein
MHDPIETSDPSDAQLSYHEGAPAMLSCIRTAAETHRHFTSGSIDQIPDGETMAEAAVGLLVILQDLLTRHPDLHQDLADVLLTAEVNLESEPLQLPAEELVLGDQVCTCQRWGRVVGHHPDHLGYVRVDLDDDGPTIAFHHRELVTVARPDLGGP